MKTSPRTPWAHRTRWPVSPAGTRACHSEAMSSLLNPRKTSAADRPPPDAGVQTAAAVIFIRNFTQAGKTSLLLYRAIPGHQKSRQSVWGGSSGGSQWQVGYQMRCYKPESAGKREKGKISPNCSPAPLAHTSTGYGSVPLCLLGDLLGLEPSSYVLFTQPPQ